MNWEAIGAAGEVLGAIAVVATLLYVSRQLREQNRALTTTVRDSAFQQLQEWNYQIVADPQLGHLFQLGAASDDWDQFTPEERSRLIHVFLAYASQPGCRRYWMQRRGTLDSRFVKLLDEMGAPTLKTGLQMTEG